MTLESQIGSIPGRIVGIGVDIIEPQRVGRDVEETPGFANGFCSEKEIIFCDEVSGEERRVRFARHFSLKEAAIKALGGAGETGQEPELDWREIIVREECIDSVFTNLTGRAKKRADELGITDLNYFFAYDMTPAIVVCIATKYV